jgi:phage/plasmid-like protein (TIGR03299 family)
MSHEIESMMSLKQTPWHGLGTIIQDAVSFDEAMRLAGLDWRVRTAPLYFKPNAASPITQAEDAQIVIRESDNAQLGTVGVDYTIVQNDDSMRPTFDALNSDKRITIETAGSLRGGRKVWMLARINNAEADVLKGDAVRGYILVATSHDGTMAHTTQFTGTRVVCANTLAVALHGGGSRVRVHHKGNAVDTVKEVSKLIDVATGTFQASVEQYQRLARRNINMKDLERYVRVVFQIPEPLPGETDTSKLVPKIAELAYNGIGMDLPGVRGTLWAAYNAVTEQLTHHRGKSQDVRLDSLAFGQNALINQRALKTALDMATA